MRTCRLTSEPSIRGIDSNGAPASGGKRRTKRRPMQGMAQTVQLGPHTDVRSLCVFRLRLPSD